MKRIETPQGQWSVVVIEMTVLNIKGWHARCCACDWEGRGRNTQKRAVQDAKDHGTNHAKAHA